MVNEVRPQIAATFFQFPLHERREKQSEVQQNRDNRTPDKRNQIIIESAIQTEMQCKNPGKSCQCDAVNAEYCLKYAFP